MLFGASYYKPQSNRRRIHRAGVLAHKLAEETINYLFFGGERKLQTSKIIEQAVQDYINVLQNYVNENSDNIVMLGAEQPVKIELDEESKKAV